MTALQTLKSLPAPAMPLEVEPGFVIRDWPSFVAECERIGVKGNEASKVAMGVRVGKVVRLIENGGKQNQ